ncbi:hypothetical protein [Faecalimicrobium sp. JNUCC 81]
MNKILLQNTKNILLVIFILALLPSIINTIWSLGYQFGNIVVRFFIN